MGCRLVMGLNLRQSQCHKLYLDPWECGWKIPSTGWQERLCKASKNSKAAWCEAKCLQGDLAPKKNKGETEKDLQPSVASLPRSRLQGAGKLRGCKGVGLFTKLPRFLEDQRGWIWEDVSEKDEQILAERGGGNGVGSVTGRNWLVFCWNILTKQHGSSELFQTRFQAKSPQLLSAHPFYWLRPPGCGHPVTLLAEVPGFQFLSLWQLQLQPETSFLHKQRSGGQHCFPFSVGAHNLSLSVSVLSLGPAIYKSCGPFLPVFPFYPTSWKSSSRSCTLPLWLHHLFPSWVYCCSFQQETDTKTVTAPSCDYTSPFSQLLLRASPRVPHSS